MKITAFVSLLIAALFVFVSCININIGNPDTTETSSDTDVAVTSTADTTAAGTETTAADTETTAAQTDAPDVIAEFYETHGGYWTEKENGKFFNFAKHEGVYRVTYAVWNAGGPFPSGVVKEVKKAGEGMYFLIITVDGMPDDPDWYGDGWDPYDVTLAITDHGTDPASFDAVGIGETEQRTYYFHTKAENPYLP